MIPFSFLDIVFMFRLVTLYMGSISYPVPLIKYSFLNYFNLDSMYTFKRELLFKKQYSFGTPQKGNWQLSWGKVLKLIGWKFDETGRALQAVFKIQNFILQIFKNVWLL